MTGMNKDAECNMYLGCSLIDDAQVTKPEFNGGEPYGFNVPASLRKDVPTWSVKESIAKIVESYKSPEKSPKDDVILYVIGQLLQGNLETTYHDRKYTLRESKGITINDKVATLEEKIEKFASYYPDVGNLFKIELYIRESGA